MAHISNVLDDIERDAVTYGADKAEGQYGNHVIAVHLSQKAGRSVVTYTVDGYRTPRAEIVDRFSGVPREAEYADLLALARSVANARTQKELAGLRLAARNLPGVL